MGPSTPTVVQAPAPVSTENNAETQAAIKESQQQQRLAAQKALGRSKTILSGSDVNPVTGESVGSLLGGQ